MRPSQAVVKELLYEDADPWRVGYGALYELCARRPLHRESCDVIGKIWLIGRTYAAAIERRDAARGGIAALGDAFYIEEVAPRIVESDIDLKLASIPEDADAEQVVDIALDVHAYLLSVFRDLTGREKRWLASKYLHFHRPNAFLICDSRALKAVRSVKSRKAKQRTVSSRIWDQEYARFVHDALDIRRTIIETYGLALTPRQLDHVFLAIAHGDV